MSLSFIAKQDDSTVDSMTIQDDVILACFSELWTHTADSMFIMCVENDGEFTLYDNNKTSKDIMGIDESTFKKRMNKLHRQITTGKLFFKHD